MAHYWQEMTGANRLLASACLPLGACCSSPLGVTTHNLEYIWEPNLRKKRTAALILLASSLANVSNSSRNLSGYSPRHSTQCTGMSLRGGSAPWIGTWHSQSTFKWFEKFHQNTSWTHPQCNDCDWNKIRTLEIHPTIVHISADKYQLFLDPQSRCCHLLH